MISKEILKKVRQIEIATRKSVNDVMAGEYHSVFKGRGMEFDEVREYLAGDDIRSIDWNVTARMGSPFVKRFVEERELTVMLVVDASGSLDFGSSNQMKGEVAVELCALLAFSAIKNNDRVGLIIFTEQIEKFIPPKKGRKHVLQLIRELLFFKPRHRGTDISGTLEFLNKVLNRRSVVFLVSDFQDQQLRKPLSIVNRKHDLVAILLNDPREAQLPPIGFLELEDAETGEVILVDSFNRNVRKTLANRKYMEQQQLDNLLRSLGIDNVRIQTNKPYTEPLIKFFRQRAGRY